MSDRWYGYYEPDYDNYKNEGYVPILQDNADNGGKVQIYQLFRVDTSSYGTSFQYNYFYFSSNRSYDGDTCYVVLQTYEGYKFNRIYTYDFNDPDDESKYLDIGWTERDDGTERTDNIYLRFSIYTGIYIDVKDTGKQCTVTYDLTHCSITPNDETFEAYSSVDFTITPDDYYTFDDNNIPYLEIDGNKTYFDLNSEKTRATLSVEFGSGENVTISATAYSDYNDIIFNLENCTINDTTTPQPPNTEITYTLTGNNNYYFNGDTPYIEVSNGERFYFTVDTDLHTATYTFTTGEGLTYTVNASANYVIPKYTFTHDIQNATATPDAGEYDENTNINVNITSDNGYYFTDNEELGIAPAILDEDGNILSYFTQPTGSRTINGITWYTGNFRGITMQNNRTVRAYAMNPYELEYVDVTEDLTGCRCTHSEQYLKGATVELTAEVSNTAYVFNDAPEIQFTNGEILKFTVTEDLKSANITFTANDNFTIYGHAETPKVYHNVTGNFTNCYLESADTFAEGEDYTILIRANDGYIFNDNIEINYNYLYVNLDSSCFYDDDTLVRYTLPASYNVTTDIRIISAVAIRDVETVSNFAHLYKVTTRILNELAKVRFYTVSSESSEVVDYGQYITNLMRIPFALPDDYTGDNANIQLGMYDSGVSAPTILYDDLYIDIGTIHVTPKYNNVYDYRETTAILHLPFSEDIEIPLEYCMDKDVHITYKMDLYTGDTTIIITSAFTGDIVATSTVTIGTQIPFIQMQNDSIVNRLEKFIDNGIRTAFIEIKRNIPYNVYCEFGKPTVDYGIIGDYKGYIEVSDCTINVPCTTSEQELIKTTLQSGIIIK